MNLKKKYIKEATEFHKCLADIVTIHKKIYDMLYKNDLRFVPNQQIHSGFARQQWNALEESINTDFGWHSRANELRKLQEIPKEVMKLSGKSFDNVKVLNKQLKKKVSMLLKIDSEINTISSNISDTFLKSPDDVGKTGKFIGILNERRKNILTKRKNHQLIIHGKNVQLEFKYADDNESITSTNAETVKDAFIDVLKKNDWLITGSRMIIKVFLYAKNDNIRGNVNIYANFREILIKLNLKNFIESDGNLDTKELKDTLTHELIHSYDTSMMNKSVQLLKKTYLEIQNVREGTLIFLLDKIRSEGIAKAGSKIISHFSDNQLDSNYNSEKVRFDIRRNFTHKSVASEKFEENFDNIIGKEYMKVIRNYSDFVYELGEDIVMTMLIHDLEKRFDFSSTINRNVRYAPLKRIRSAKMFLKNKNCLMMFANKKDSHHFRNFIVKLSKLDIYKFFDKYQKCAKSLNIEPQIKSIEAYKREIAQVETQERKALLRK